MASTEGGQPRLLDLVDDRRNPDLEEPVVERARARPPDVVDDRKVRSTAQRLHDGRRDVAARKQELERAVEVDHERRLQPLDEAHQRLRLGLRAGMLARLGEIRAVRDHSPLVLDPGRIRERVVRSPRRGGKIAVQVDSGRVLPRAVDQPVRVGDRHHHPAGRVSPDALEQATCKQGRHRLLPVLGRYQQPCGRAASLREERPQGDAVPRAAVLLHAPAVEEVSRHGPTVAPPEYGRAPLSRLGGTR